MSNEQEQQADRLYAKDYTFSAVLSALSYEARPMGPKERRSIVLSPMEEAAIVALRVQARLPLDDVYIALKDVIPHMTRSSLRR